jgi:AraC-like DNA-binding protein
VRSPGRIRAAALRPLLAVVESAGRDTSGLFEASGLDPQSVEDGAERWVPAILTDQLWAAAGAHMPEDLPLRVADSVGPTSFGLLSYLLACSADVGAALARLPTHYALLSRATSYRLEVDASGAHLTIDLQGARPPCVESFAGAVALCFLQKQAAAPLPLREVRLMQERPSDDRLAAAHARIFGARVRYGAPTLGWSLERSALSIPLRGNEPVLCALLAEHAAELLSRPSLGTLAERVRDQIGVRGAQCNVRAAAVAADLGLSERTLRRLLRGEGTTFQAELDAVLATKAAAWLESASVEDVAAALGFAETAAFRRAFRRWHGAPPRAYVRAAGNVNPRPR